MRQLKLLILSLAIAVSAQSQTNIFKWIQLKNIGPTDTVSAANGWIWYNSTYNKFSYKENGVVKHFGSGGSSSFGGLTDGPGALSGNGLKYFRVNVGATALEYRTVSQVLSDISAVPTSRTLTINGTAFDLSADRTVTQDNITGLSSTGLIKRTAANTLAIATAGTDYLTGNQTITLSGDVTGSGTTAITTAIGANKVTNTMLAGSIADDKLATIYIKADGTRSFTGDQSIGGFKLTNVKELDITGTAGSGFINFVAQSSNASAPAASGFNLFSGSTGSLNWAIKNGTDTYVRTFDATLTANRTYTLQDASSTIAMYSNNLSVFAATTSLELAGVISDETGTGKATFATSPTFTTGITIIGAGTGSRNGFQYLQNDAATNVLRVQDNGLFTHAATVKGSSTTNTWTSTADGDNGFTFVGTVTGNTSPSTSIAQYVFNPTFTWVSGATQNASAVQIDATFSGSWGNTHKLLVGTTNTPNLSVNAGVGINTNASASTSTGIALNVLALNSTANTEAVNIKAGGTTSAYALNVRNGSNNPIFTILANGSIVFNNRTGIAGTAYSFTQSGLTGSGSPKGMSFTGGAHISITGEAIDLDFVSTRAVNFNTYSGVQRSVKFGVPTYGSSTGTTTISRADNIYITGAPIAGTGSVTITTSNGLYVDASAVSSNVTTSYGAYINAQTGATNNYALGLNGTATGTNFIDAYSTTSTAAGTTTLTTTSNYYQGFTGSTTQTVKLPVVTTMLNGQAFMITNASSGTVTVQTSGSNTIKAMASNSTLSVWVIDTTAGTGTASWNWQYTASLNN